MNSILDSIKKRLGLPADYGHFDDDIIMDINSVLSILTQIGVGPEAGYSITNSNDEWTDFMSDLTKLEFVKTYVYLKVKLMFDPPQNSTVTESINRQISELEFRLLVQSETKK